MKKLCEYGCGQEAKYQFKNGKWCCSEYSSQCPMKRKETSIRVKKLWEDLNSKYNSILYRNKLSDKIREAYRDPNNGLNSNLRKEKISNKISKIWEDPNSGLNSNLCKEKISNKISKLRKDPSSVFNSVLYRNKQKLTIKKIKKQHPFFLDVEEIRYNPDKPEEKEIQVHCKNHNCSNSKEQDGWFTPTYGQIANRIFTIEKPKGFGESNFYCSQECKNECILFGARSDPLKIKNNELPYTLTEYQEWKQKVITRQKEEDDYNFCEICYSTETLHVHHEKPVKTHPHLALDPDNGIVLCQECHYKYGHKTGTECSTGNLAKNTQRCTLGGQENKERGKKKMRRFWLFRSNIRELEYYHKYKDLETFKRNCHDYYMLLPIWLLENDYFDEVIIFRLQPKNKVDDIIFTINNKKYIQKFVNNLSECFDFQKPDIAFFRGGFKEYDEITKTKKSFFPLALYLGAGRRITPQWGGKYDVLLIEDERDFIDYRKCMPFYKTASPNIFRPYLINSVKWDICWPCNFTQIKYKGQLEFIKMISQRPALKQYKIVHCGNKPEIGKKLCKQFKVTNIKFLGSVDRPTLNKVLNQSKFGLNLSNVHDGCPRVSTEILMSGTPLLIKDSVRLLKFFKNKGVIEINDTNIVSKIVRYMRKYNNIKADIELWKTL